MRYFKKVLDELLTWKWPIIFILTFIFGLSLRRNLIYSSLYIQSRLNQWDVLIGISGDPFLLLYLILPFTLLLSCISIRETYHITYLVRLRSWWRWVGDSVKVFSPIIVITVTLLFIVSLLLTIRLPYQAGWSSFSSAPLSTFNHLSFISRESNFSPYAVLLLQLCLLIIFLLAIHALIAAFYLYCSNLLYLGMVSLSILLYSLITFRYFPEFPKLGPFNYMTFPSSYETYPSVYPAFIISTGILIISIRVIPLLKKWR